MSDSLFEISSDEPEPDATSEPALLREDQVRQIRESFDAAGITGQVERKELIEAVIAREVDSLREIREAEALRIVFRINELIVKAKPKAGGSAWDDREEATWIDRL